MLFFGLFPVGISAAVIHILVPSQSVIVQIVETFSLNALRVMRMSKPIQFRIKSKGDNATMNIVYVYEVGLEGFDALVALVFMRRSRRRRRLQVRLI